VRLSRLAQLLLFRSASITCFAQLSFSIVLTMAVGQDAALLCKDWCYQPAASAVGCRHHDATTSSTVSADDNCRNLALDAIAFVREDARRGAAAPDAQNAMEASH
jgi:hypothetical protein